MQSNQNLKDGDICIIDNDVWNNLFNKMKYENDIHILKKNIDNISKQYNIDKKNIIKDFFNYIIRNNENLNIPEYFNFVENILHFEDCKNDHYVNYSLIKLLNFLHQKNK